MAVYRRGNVWWFHFEFEGRHLQESSRFTNKTAALRAEAKRKAELLERRAGFSRRELPPKFEDYVLLFLAWSKQQHRPATWALHKANCDALLRHFKGKWLDGITPGMVEDFKFARLRDVRRNAHDGSTISNATVNRALTTLKLLFHHAERCGLAVGSPTQGVALLEEAGRMRVITFEEELAYFQAASQPLRDIARVILETGMRPEEVYRMEVADLNFDRRTIFNPRGKTKAARRTLPMTQEIWELLKRRAIAARGKYIFPSATDPNRHIGCVRKARDRAVARAGIKEPFRLYDLRHTYATRAVMAGVDLPTLAALLGHTSIQMTTRYVHPAEEHKREAVAKLEVFKFAAMQKAVETIRGPLHFPLQGDFRGCKLPPLSC
jgi:integrase